MIVGVAIIDFYMPEVLSLKEKRHYIRSIKDKLNSHFKISISEIDFQETWQRSKIGAVAIGADKAGVNEVLSALIKFSQKQWPDLILDIKLEFINL